MLVALFVFRIIIGIVISVAFLSLITFNKKWNLRKTLSLKVIAFLLLKVSLGALITISPIIYSNNYSQEFIIDKIQNESELTQGNVYELTYGNRAHFIGHNGYKYEFYVQNKRYTGRVVSGKSKIGKKNNFKYYKKNPWVNEIHK